jgi:integrase
MLYIVNEGESMSVSKRGNGSWEVRYRDPEGKHRSKSFRTKDLARKYEISVRDSIQKGVFSTPVKTKITLEELFNTYMSSNSHFKPKTRADLYSLWNYLIKPEFGNVPISALNLEKIHKWINKSVNGSTAITSGARMGKALGYLTRILDFALDLGYINANPMLKSNGKPLKITLPQSDKTRLTQALSLPQLKALSAECYGYEELVMLLGTCGLRWAEAVGLRASDFKSKATRLEITRTLSEQSGIFTPQTTKTGKHRTIYVPESLSSQIWMRIKNLEPDELVFTNSVGNPLSNSGFRNRVYNPAIERSGIPKITIHDLRHTAASLAISNGANIKVISRMLGHSDASMTLRVYSHAFDDDMKKLSDDIDTQLRSSEPTHLRRIV